MSSTAEGLSVEPPDLVLIVIGLLVLNVVLGFAAVLLSGMAVLMVAGGS
jgi:hypothetical protein